MKKDPFLKLLHTHTDSTFALLSVPGNSGDVLLQKGLELYLEKYHFKVTDEPTKADIILIHGGGNIDDVWRVGVTLLSDILRRYSNKTVVVAPSTCHFSSTDFAKVLHLSTSPIHIFTRETYSLHRLKALSLPDNVSLDVAPDTAFLLEGTDYLKSLQQATGSKYILAALRTDRESTLVGIESKTHSKKPWQFGIRWYQRRRQCEVLRERFGIECRESGVTLEDVSLAGYDYFVSSISEAKEIYTDRLHVGILGAMLGKPVHLLPTKYDKIQGVYHQTLHRYPNVTPWF